MTIFPIIYSLASLKVEPPSMGAIVFLMDKVDSPDDISGYYRWDSSRVVTEDSVLMRTFCSSVASPGQWVKILTNRPPLPHGKLVLSGGLRTFYGPAITNSAGEATINLTADGTAAGEALFTDVWFMDGKTSAGTGTFANVIRGDLKALSADKKQLTYLFSRGPLITIAGIATIGPPVAAPAGTAVAFMVQGI